MRIKWFSFVRILGLILVLTYHFFKIQLPGGFIGVDIFFTFSGYLITALMVDEFTRSQNFKLVAFYRRRFYRIFPPLALAVLISMPFTFLVSPDFVANIGKQIAAALGFTTNFFEIATGGNYETQFIPHLFVHTWSLAVEMHYYLFWGLMAFLLAALIRHHTKKQGLYGSDPTQNIVVFKIWLFVFALIFALTSLASMIFLAQPLKEFSPVYFSSLTHSFPFFIGSGLGVLAGIKNTSTRFRHLVAHFPRWLAITTMMMSAIVLIALSFVFKFDALSTYRYGFLIASLLAGMMIIAARILHEKTPNTNEPKVVTFLADTSYSVYLFHWPLFVVFSHLFSAVEAAALTVVLSLIFSALSYYVLEPWIAGKPVRLGRHELQHTRHHWLLVTGQLAFTLVIAALVGITGYTVQAAPQQTGLETNLWVNGIYQDVTQIQTAHDQVSSELQTKKALAKADQAKKSATTASEKAAAEQKATAASIPDGVSIIGDSVTLGTSRYLSAHVPDNAIDAEGNRTMNLAYNVMMQQQQNHNLRRDVVIAIGTNALNDWQLQTQRVIDSLNPGHRLIFMTPHDGHATPSYNSEKLAVFERTLPDKYDFITIADWNRLAKQHPEVFKGTDGTHFGGVRQGDILFAQCINAALAQAKKQPVKRATNTTTKDK